jgi:hypothetical protein
MEKFGPVQKLLRVGYFPVMIRRPCQMKNPLLPKYIRMKKMLFGILKVKDGSIWFGSDGVYRYNGNTIRQVLVILKTQTFQKVNASILLLITSKAKILLSNTTNS